MHFLQRGLIFLDRHSGLISAVGLVLAGIGVLLTLKYLLLYREEVRKQRVEQERLAWERILKLLHQIAKYSALANLSSVNHSPLAVQGVLPPEIAVKYEFATETLFSYWHQLRVELDLMPDSTLIERIQGFVLKYDSSADARASVQFGNDLSPITQEVIPRAQKSF
jgi:hypothetical protein